jgi:hypothetical protein
MSSWYALRREAVTNHTGGVFHQFRLVQEVWLVPSDDPNAVADAAAKMREHPEVQAGLQRVRCEEFTWQPEVTP